MSRPITIGHNEAGRPITLPIETFLTGAACVGGPGGGKSKFLEGIARQIIQGNHGALIIDPHGPLFDGLVAFLARYRPRRPVYILNFSHPTAGVFGISPFQRRSGDLATRVQRTVGAMLKSWAIPNIDATPVLAHWTKNSVALLMEREDISVAELPLLLSYGHRELRAHVSRGTSVEREWLELNEHRSLSGFLEQTRSTYNRLDVLASATATRRFFSLTDPAANIDWARVMDEGALLLCRVQPSSELDPRNMRLIGTMLLSELFDVARQRELTPERPPRPFFVITDEVQNFLTPDLASLFAEGRKFGIATIIAHQFIAQLREEDPRLLAAVNNACLTKIVFRIGGADDALELAGELFADVDLQEVKFTTWRTAFRPVSIRERSVSRSRGGGSGISTSRTETEGEQDTTAQSRGYGYNTGRQTGRGITQSEGTSDTQSWSETDSEGESYTQGTSHSDSAGFSHTDGTSDGDSVSHGFGQSHSDSESVSAAGDDGQRSSSDGSDRNTTVGRSNGSSASDSYSASSSDTVSDSYSRSTARATSRGEARTTSRSLAASYTESESEGEAYSETDTESFGTSRSTARGRSNSLSESWSESITDQPGTRHEEFQEPSYEFYKLDEQRHRQAAALRQQRPRHFTIRTPDSRVRSLAALNVEPIMVSSKLTAAYQLEVARKIGARPAEEVDRLITERQQRLFDVMKQATVDSKDDDYVESPSLTSRKSGRQSRKPS